MKYKFYFFLISLFGLVGFASCSSTDEKTSYDDWQSRNEHYMDSISTVARANAGDAVGQWIIIKSFTQEADGLGQTGDVKDYVYAKIKRKGAGTDSPLYTDSVAVNYRGWNIINEIFDQSYKGTFDETLNVPTVFKVGSVIYGWTTALQQMHEGDIWTVYIPADLAYGSSNQSSTIPAYSALIFDINLVKIYKVQHLR